MSVFAPVRSALWTLATELRCKAQEHDRKVEHLYAEAVKEAVHAATLRVQADHLATAAKQLAKDDGE